MNTQSQLTEAQLTALKPWAILYIANFCVGVISFVVLGVCLWQQLIDNRIAASWAAMTLLVQATIRGFCIFNMRRVRATDDSARLVLYSYFDYFLYVDGALLFARKIAGTKEA